MTLFLSYLINGISLGSVYAIIALGYTMVYGIAKMLNFAHGDVIMIGAYVSFCAMQYLRLARARLRRACDGRSCTALGIVIEGLAYKPLRQAPSLAVLITAIGVSYFLQNSALLIWGSAPKSYPSVVTLGSINLMDGQLRHLRRAPSSPCSPISSSWWRSRCLPAEPSSARPCAPSPKIRARRS